MAGLVLLAGPALAQDGPLTTLMRPQPLSGPAPLGRGSPLAGQDRLFGDNPLASVDSLTGQGSLSTPRPARARPDAAKPGEEAASCDPRTVARPPPRAASGGSGPGEYARFVESGEKPPAAVPPRTAAVGEQPLYGGTDRPLWGDPKPRAPGPAKPAAARAPAPGTDRPLWADAGAARDAAADRCDTDAGTRRAGAAAPPTSTLFFGSGPAR